MPGDIVRTPSRDLVDLADRAIDYASAARADATRRAYASDWRAFESWMEGHGLDTLPALPDAVALYLTYMASEGLRASTIARALSAISQAHRFAGFDSPRRSARVSETMRGIQRRLGTAPAQKAPVLVGDLREMLRVVPDSLLGLRDRAILLLGFSGAFRRAELVALDVEHLRFTRDGLEVLIARAKTDQIGAGRKIGVPCARDVSCCPVRAARAWLDRAELSSGAVFRRVSRGSSIGVRLAPRSVALVVQRYAEAAGMPSERYAGHSLRSGLATSAARAGKTERAIMSQTGHRSVVMVRRYIRDGELLGEDNAADGLL